MGSRLKYMLEAFCFSNRLFQCKDPYTVPPDQNNMFSPPPQPKIPLKMQILSKNAIFVTEKVNFYPNN